MADTATITANVQDGSTINSNVSEGVTITTNVTEGVAVTANVTTGGKGDNGEGVPVGGTTGQVLAKASSTDYDTEWVDQSGGSGAVDSVNSQTGTVVLDADDIDDTSTTHKFVTASDLTTLSNTSGTNTGDQDLSSYATTAAVAAGYQPLDADLTALAALTSPATKLNGIEAGADVTDTANVTAAGALMDSEVANLAAVKAFDPTDYATAAQGALADTALQSGDVTAATIDTEASADGYVLTSDGAGNAAWEAVSGSGTVTSVAQTVPTGFTVAGSPVTGSGTLAISYDTGYQGYTTTEAGKLSNIEANADVTDATNVAAAGAVMDGDFSTNGLMKRTGAGTYTSVTDNSSNWDTAYGWGDHASGGYAADSAVVHDTGDETVAGVKTFSSFPITPSAAPTTDYQTANKKYVDDEITAAGGYNDESAQDAIGTILTDSSEIDFTYNDATPSITASIVAGSIDETKLDTSVNASLDLADSATQPGDLATVATTGAYSDLSVPDGSIGIGKLTEQISPGFVGSTNTGPGGTPMNYMSASDARSILNVEDGADVTDATNVAAAGAYMSGGTDVALADGGTGASLTDPNADRIMFWDDSAGAVTWLTPSTGLTVSGTNMTVRTSSTTQTGIVELATTAETTTATDTARAVTPAGIGAERSATATLTNKTLTSPVINTPTGIVKGDVGLGNVDNTSDATKNAATATLTNKTISGASNTISDIGPSQRTGGFYIGTISAATLGSTGNKSITGVGFTPKLVEFDVLVGAATTSSIIDGEGAMTSSSQFMKSTYSSTSSVRKVSSTSDCIGWSLSTSTALLASYVSMDADGFTINVSIANSGFDVAFRAWA